jgi:hypothetical protein
VDPTVLGILGEPDVGCLDAYSLAHFTGGFLLDQQFGNDAFLPSMAALVGWELIEPLVWPGYAETDLNVQCDLLLGVLGWMWAAPLKGRAHLPDAYPPPAIDAQDRKRPPDESPCPHAPALLKPTRPPPSVAWGPSDRPVSRTST